MLKTRRQPGDRRWGMCMEFPLRDSSGVVVAAERRKLSERRMTDITLADLAALMATVTRNSDD